MKKYANIKDTPLYVVSALIAIAVCYFLILNELSKAEFTFIFYFFLAILIFCVIMLIYVSLSQQNLKSFSGFFTGCITIFSISLSILSLFVDDSEKTHLFIVMAPLTLNLIPALTLVVNNYKKLSSDLAKIDKKKKNRMKLKRPINDDYWDDYLAKKKLYYEKQIKINRID